MRDSPETSPDVIEARYRSRMSPRTLNIELGLSNQNTFNLNQSAVNSSATGANSAVLSSIATGTNACFIPITQIMMADGHTKAIAHIKIRDMVMAFDRTGKFEPKMVTDTFAHLVGSYMLVEFEDGHTTGLDGKHQYWTQNDRYAPISTLDYVWHWSDAWRQRKIVDRRIVVVETILHNITVADHHNYLANFDAVSNIKRNIDDFME